MPKTAGGCLRLWGQSLQRSKKTQVFTSDAVLVCFCTWLTCFLLLCCQICDDKPNLERRCWRKHGGQPLAFVCNEERRWFAASLSLERSREPLEPLHFEFTCLHKVDNWLWGCVRSPDISHHGAELGTRFYIYMEKDPGWYCQLIRFETNIELPWNSSYLV